MATKYNVFTNNLDVVNEISTLVVGPSVATDNAVVRFDGTTGKLIQNSGTTLTDADALSTGSLTLTTDLAVTEGGTGASALTGVLTGNGTGAVTGATVTQHGVLLGGASNAVSSTAVGTSGDVLTSSGAGSDPTYQTPTAGTVTSVSGTASRISSTGGATPVIDVDSAYVGQSSITTLGTVTTGTWTGDTIALANGGTGSTSATAGSVVFSNGSILTQDNANLFFDDTNNRLGIGITTPLDTLHVVGAMELDHTAAENDDHALEIVCDANGFTDVKAVDIDYITGALAAGEDEEAILVNIDESASTGGIVAGYLVLTTAEGSATVNGYETGINVNPIVHESGTFGDADSILNKAVDVIAALASGGAGSISIFVLDNESITIGDAAQWGEHEIILATGASGAGVAPTFEYSTGGAGFSAFSPADGTNGFRNTGAILWDASTLAGWVTATSGNYEVKITRTRNSLSTTPIIDELQIAALTEFKWDKNGDVNLNSLTLATDLAVAEGGTGASTLTGVLTGNGTSAVTANAVTQYGVLLGGASNAVGSTSAGTSGQVMTSGGAGVNPDWAAAGGGSWVLLSTQTASASASLEVKNTILTSTYDLYILYFENFLPAADDTLEMVFSPDNGSTYRATTYRYALVGRNDAGGAETANSQSAATIILQPDEHESTGESDGNLFIELIDPLSSATGTSAIFRGQFMNSSATPDQVIYQGMGNYPTAEAHNAVKILYNGNNIASGVLRTYGVKTS